MRLRERKGVEISVKHSNYQGEYVSSNRILYTPSEFARENLFYLQEIGQVQAKRPHKSSHPDLASYLFMMVLSGSGTLAYLGEKYALSAGDCALVNCKNEYYHESSRDLWTIRFIHFYGPTASGVYRKYLERGGKTVFRPKDRDGFMDCFDQTAKLASSDDHIRDMKINEQLAALCCLLMAQSWHPEAKSAGKETQSLLAVKEYLRDHLSEKITLDMLSEKFYMNKYYLTRLFKIAYGITPGDYLLQLRMSHAKELLRFSTLSVEEIGERCGITPLYYFSRIFRQAEGVSPRDYRKMWR